MKRGFIFIDREINPLVYELTEEEIRIVEGVKDE
jgi:hypothetical protein